MEAKAGNLASLNQISIPMQRRLCSPSAAQDKKISSSLVKLNTELGSGQLLPYHIILALDGSGSMHKELPEGISRWDGLQNGVQTMLNMRRASAPGVGDLVSVIVYDNDIKNEIIMRPINDSFAFDIGGGGTAFTTAC